MGLELGIAAGVFAGCLGIVLLGRRRLARRLRAARAAGTGARYSRQVARRMAAAYVVLGALLCVVGLTEFFVTEGSWPILGIIAFFGLACAAIGLNVLVRERANAKV